LIFFATVSSYNFRNHPPQCIPLLLAPIFLLVLIEQKQQVSMIAVR
jgi:hypothetical protein